MLKFDHIALGARDLEKSSKTLSEQLGVLPFGGGEHELFGTHNKLWRIETKAYPIYFELLAINSGLDATLRAEVMAQAGQAWLQAGEPEKADGALSDAIVVRPRDPSIWIDRSVVRASVGDYDRAILDLAQALRIDPDRVEALTLRSAAYRLTGRTDAALDDINAALARDPGNPEALLERGILREGNGDKDGARRDWIQVLTITPESPTGQAARNHIERMDVSGKPPG